MGPLASWVLELLDNSSESSFSASLAAPKVIGICSYLWFLPSGRPLSLSITWEVHCRSDPSSVLLIYLGENGLERKLLVFANALKGRLPSPILFPYQPSVIGIVLDLACPVPSHCYNVHPELSAHCPKLCQCQSFVPALPDSLAKI